MVKGTQDGETSQQKKIQEIFSAEKKMWAHCHNDTNPQTVFSNYVATLRMDIAPKMYVGQPFVFHEYVIRKYCMVSVPVGIKENYKKGITCIIL